MQQHALIKTLNKSFPVSHSTHKSRNARLFSNVALNSSSSPTATTATTGNDEKLRQEAMNAEIEAAVVRGIEAEMVVMQETVAEAVANSLDTSVRFDLRANFNTLVALTGVVIFERGIWSSWDLIFGDSVPSDLISIGVGLAIMISVPVFKIPLAEWRRPGLD